MTIKNHPAMYDQQAAVGKNYLPDQQAALGGFPMTTPQTLQGEGMTEIPEEIAPVPFMARTRFKLSFNTVGNCTSMKNFAEQFDGEWVWLVDAHNGGNSPLYTAEAMGKAILAERKRIADDLFQRQGFMTAETDDGKHFVKVSFPSMEEMHGFHFALVKLSQFKTAHPHSPTETDRSAQ